MTLRRMIVNVATGRYLRGQQRLLELAHKFSPGASIQTWTDSLPVGCPPHRDRPYAFKAFAMKEAEPFADLILWCDASVQFLGSLERLWQKIENEGYWIALNGWTNYEWTADSAYPDLFPGVPLDMARKMNKTFPQVVATAFGLNLRDPVGHKFFNRYYELAQTNAFCGPWANSNCPPDKRFNYGPDSSYTTAPCGPPDVLGHRHDQTAASVIAWELGMTLTHCPDVLSYPPGAAETLLLVAGA